MSGDCDARIVGGGAVRSLFCSWCLLDFGFRHRLAPSSGSIGLNSWTTRNHDGRAVRRAAALAIINSSSVRMTRTLTGPWSVEIRRAFDALRPSSKAIPRNPSPAQIRRANLGRVLTDPPGEHQCVQPAERGGEGADPLLRLVAKQFDRLGRPDIAILPFQEIAHVGTGFRDAQQAGLVVHEAVELVGASFLRPATGTGPGPDRGRPCASP